MTPRDLIKAGRPAEPRGPTTGPKKTPHPLGCQKHCKRGASAPDILTVMPTSPTPRPSPDNGALLNPGPPRHNVRPRRLAAVTAGTEGEAGWGGLLQDGTLIERLSDEPGHHIYPTHPSCPTNGHK